jgi:hypothetical protein
MDNPGYIAVLMLSLRDFENLELASLNNGITGFGKVSPMVRGFKKAVEAKLIGEDSRPYETEDLKTAMSFEIRRRIESGDWK